MVQKEIINVPELHGPYPKSYEHCIKVGNRVYIAGQVGRDENGLVSYRFEPQARRCFERIEFALEAAGGSLEDLVAMTVYVTDMRYKNRFTEIRREVLGDALPTSALIGVDSLSEPGMLIEIQSEAAVSP